MVIALVFALAALAAQQDDFDKVEVTSAKVAEGVYVLNGRGGNIGVSVGEDGVFLIDDQYAPLTTKIRAAVSALTHTVRAARSRSGAGTVSIDCAALSSICR